MMNKVFSVILLTLVTVVGFSMFQQQDTGYLKIAFAGFEFETSLLIVLLASLLVLFAISLIAGFLDLMSRVFACFGIRRHERMAEKARHALSQGLIDLAEGRFDRAEKGLLTQVKHNDNALLAYLGAARAAQQQGAHDRRDKYLRLAHEIAPEAETAISLTKAELQLDHAQHEQALATLTLLAENTHKHEYVHRLLAHTYRKLEDWHSLESLLPELKRLRAMSQQDLHNLEIETCVGIIDELAVSRNVDALSEHWNGLSRQLRSDPELLSHYARSLTKLEAAGEAEQVLRQYLTNNWSEELIRLYAELDVNTDTNQLKAAEEWLRSHQQNPWLLLALGNMCTWQQLWGKARTYYENSLAVQPMAVTYLRLARLLEEHMHEEDAAREYYRQGMHLLAGDYGDTELEKLGNEVRRESGKPALKVV